jgi:hypothetical protein
MAQSTGAQGVQSVGCVALDELKLAACGSLAETNAVFVLPPLTILCHLLLHSW